MDSYQAHYETYRTALARFGVDLTEERLLEVYSPNWYHVYEALELPRAHWPQADAAWLEEIQDHRPKLFPGVREALSSLRARYRLAIVTSGSRSRVEVDLSRNRLETVFEMVVTHEDVTRPKPAPEGLDKVLDRFGLEPAQALYVGDSDADREMAVQVGVDFIAVQGPFNGPGLSDAEVPKIGGLDELCRMLWSPEGI